VNVSKVFDDDYEIYEKNKEYVNEFINDYFKSDLELWNIIENKPEMFKLVI
jgi:hypothetical protein